MTTKERAKFRSSKLWKDFRIKLKHKRRHDELTNMPLHAKWNLHHLCMSHNEEDYTNLKENLFCCLNSKSHEVIHYLFVYYRKDKDVLKRLKKILDKMIDLNCTN